MSGPTPAARQLSSFRLAARLARRETLRRPWRTLLVALLISVPVAGMVVAAVWVRTDHQTPTGQWRAQYGKADLFATPGAPRGAAVEPGGPSLDELLPEGTRTVRYRSEYSRIVRTIDGRRSTAEITDLPMADPLAAPIIQVTSGRAPHRAGEVFLARSVAKRLGVHVGDQLSLERPESVEWTVVGLGERRAWWGSDLVILGPGTSFPWRDTNFGPSQQTVLADLPDDLTAAQLAALSRFPEGAGFAPGLVPSGTSGATHWDTSDSSDSQAVAWSWVIGAIALTVVGIVIAAAFAAGARRQLATLGQLAANGASPAVLRRVLFLQGTWTGVLGAALGLGLAAATLAAAAPHVDRLLGRDVDPYTMNPSDLIPIVVLGVVAATLAALIPARTTARTPVLAALAGRRPLRRVPAWLTATGVAVGAAGLALLGLAVLGSNEGTSNGNIWALTAIVGGVAVLLGACAIAPGYVSILEPLASRLRGASRLAARSLARQRTRTGAVVSAVCATSALAVAASALVLSADAQDHGKQWMRPDEVHLQATMQDPVVGDQPFGPRQTPAAVSDELLADILDAIPDAEVHQIAAVALPSNGGHAQWEVREFTPDQPPPDGNAFLSLMSGPYPQLVAIADDALLDLYDLPRSARRALADVGIVAVIEGPLSGRATVVLTGEMAGEMAGESRNEQPPAFEDLISPITLDVVSQPNLTLGSLPRIFVTRERARAIGLQPVAGPTIIRAAQPLTGDQRTAVQDTIQECADLVLDAAEPNAPMLSTNLSLFYPTVGLNPRLLEALLTSAAFLLSLFVVAVSLALAAAETRDERDVLIIVGAPPPTMRRTSGHKALLLTLLGSALAVPVGFLPVSVFTAASTNGLPLVFPWRVVLLLVLAVPILAAAATTAFSGLVLRLRPVRASTMAFD